jgi:hypothetical protein
MVSAIKLLPIRAAAAVVAWMLRAIVTLYRCLSPYIIGGDGHPSSSDVLGKVSSHQLSFNYTEVEEIKGDRSGPMVKDGPF